MIRIARRRSLREDRGSGTLWMAAVAVILSLMASTVVLLGLAQTARHKANAAADLAALAAAQVLLDGTESACDEAVQNASANGARLTGCSVDGEIVSVSVSVGVRLGRFRIGQAEASARAGPVDATEPAG